MKETCFHCQQEVNDNNRIVEKINNKDENFCCVGCSSVAQIIYNSGLDAFYQRQQNNILPKTKLEYEDAIYNSAEFQQSFLENTQGKNTKQISLISDVIHCAACVWLIEKTLSQTKGIFWVRVNLLNKKIQINWDDSKISLAQIMHKLAGLGYAPQPYEENLNEEKVKKHHRDLLFRIVFAAFTMMNLLWISISLYTGAAEGKYQDFFIWLSFVLATPTLFYSGFPFLKSAFLGLKVRNINMDLPISIGALSTYIYSCWALFVNSSNDVYFDTVVNFIFVLLVGRFLESKAKQVALSQSQTLQQLQPKVVRLLVEEVEKIINIAMIKIGDVVRVKSGERIGIDGIVVEGSSMVDESILTGESKSIYKKTGDTVLCGTNNGEGTINISVTKTPQQTQLKHIIDLVEQTQSKNSDLQCTIEKFIPYFVITTLLLSLITFLFWLNTGFEIALLGAVSVLIITCPCALGLATPVSMAIANSLANKQNLLIKNNLALEITHQIKTFVFDKTGTLTTGVMKVEKILSDNPEKVLKIVASLENLSEHKIAKSIVKYAQKKSVALQKVMNFKTITGVGIQAEIDGILYRVGQLENHQNDEISLAQSQGKTVIGCFQNDNLIGAIVLEDELKSDAIKTIKKLQELNNKVIVLTGDNLITTKNVLKEIKNIKIIANCLPNDKLKVIKKLQKSNPVIMVGDGFNDSPAIAQADIGIVVDSGVAHQYADVILLSDKLAPLLSLVYLAKNTNKTIYQNIIFSVFYNIITVPLAMMGFVTPLIAAVLMPISSLVVITNAILLKKRV